MLLRRQQDLAGLGLLASIETAATNDHGRPTRYALTDTDNHRVELSAERFRVGANYGRRRLEPPAKPLFSSHVDAIIREDLVVFDGRGYGHGVGMCQYGAETLARDGTDYRDILAWYYPGAELVRAYS